jgi:hypothetical protein
LNAGRNTISLFILLIVCLGYGVIRPTLGGNLMRKCIYLSSAHFIFGVIYSGGALYVTHITSGLLVMMFVMPLSFSLTLFYAWSLQGLQETMKRLEAKRQPVKLAMFTRYHYEINHRLRSILFFSIAAICASFILNAYYFHQREAYAIKN